MTLGSYGVIKGGYGFYSSAYENMQRDGIVIGAINTINPFYHLAVLGADVKIAADNGDWKGVGGAVAKVGVAVVGTIVGAKAAPKVGGTVAVGPRAYSVAFETKIPKVGAGTRGAHFKAANEALLAEMRASSEFASTIEGLGIKVPTSGPGTALPRSPFGWSWHHVPDRPGVMRLVPTPQHQGGPWQPLFHPGGVGGFKLWGVEF